MNKQYRPLEVGETIQEGDEYYSDLTGRWEAIRYYAGYEWKNKITKARRPISLSTDTEALASKLAGYKGYPFGAEMLDAVADAPSDWPEQSKSTEPEEQEPEWNGEGFPPVGVECLMARGGEEFQLGVILFKCEKLFVFKWSDNGHEIALRYHQAEFRPIKSTADRKRTEEIQKMYSIAQELPPPEYNSNWNLEEALRYNDEQVCTALYDAGYRLKDNG